MFEKMAAGMSTIEPTPMVLLPFLRKAMRVHNIPAQAKQIDFTLAVAEADFKVAANIDPIKMNVVFRNLLSNAIKFSSKGGKVTCRVTRRTNEAGTDVVTIAVQDSGAGLSKENMKRLFQGKPHSIIDVQLHAISSLSHCFLYTVFAQRACNSTPTNCKAAAAPASGCTSRRASWTSTQAARYGARAPERATAARSSWRYPR